MTRLNTLGLCTLFLLTAAAPAGADWLFAPFLGITFRADTTLIDLEHGADHVHWTFGGSVTMIGRGSVGVEGLFVYTPGFFQSNEVAEPVVSSSRVYSLMGNVVLTIPARWTEYSLRPFVSGGIGLLHAGQRNLQNIFPISSSLLAYNLGGGAVGYVTPRTGLRFDLRYFSTLRREEEGFAFGHVRLSYWNAGVGVVFRY